MTANELSHIVIGRAIEVHQLLGPGLFERIYEHALLHELREGGMEVQSQLELPVIYKGSTWASDIALTCWWSRN